MKRMMHLTAVAAVLAGAGLMAQESVGTVVGTVRTSTGEPVAAARIQITSPALLGGRVVTSDAKGNFRMPLLPPGLYTLTSSKSGYVGGTVTFRVGATQTLRQDLILREVKTASVEVEVVATSVAVDKTDTKTATVLAAQQLQALPVSVYGPSAQFMSPGVSMSVAGGSDYASFRGSVGGASQYTINGMSVRDNVMRYGRQTAYQISDLVEDIQVMTSPLHPKHGNTSGGMVNVTTKAGTNEFSGSFRVSTDRPSWNTFNAPITKMRFGGTTLSSGSTLGVDALDRSYQVTLLGPIIKDKLTFSYGRTWSPKTTTTANLTNVLGASRGYVVGAVSGTTTAAQPGYRWGVTSVDQSRIITGEAASDVVQQGKLYWQISADHQLEVYYTQDDYGPGFDNEYAVIDDVSNRQQSSTRTLGGVNYRAIIGNGVLDVKLGRTKKEINFPSGPGETIYVRSWSSTSRSILSDYNGKSTLYLTNGDPASPDSQLRQNTNFTANYFWTNSAHSIDVGVEYLQEKAFQPESSSLNRRLYFVPGIAASGQYAVFNYGSSVLADPTKLSPGAYSAIVNTAGNGFVPEMEEFSDGGGSDATTRDTTTSFYLADQWAINNRWSVMAGFRYDNWKVENRRGTEVNSHGISPRLEAKYDLNGDNRHLLSLSYAHLRGTIGQGNLGIYARGAGNIRTRYFWSEGAGTLHYVPKSEILTPTNYTKFQTLDTDTGRYVNPDLRPELTKQVEFTYRHAFDKGGFFRGSLIYRKVTDLWYRRGINEVVTEGATTSIKNVLDFDPYQNRNYRGIELEWNLPLYRSAISQVDLNGFWSTSRSRGRVTFSEEGANTAIRFDDIYQANGYVLDDYDSYGELANSVHNDFKMWITWTYGMSGGIQSSLSLLGEYQTGNPYSNSINEYLPGVGSDDSRAMVLNYTKDTPTSLGYFQSHRGAFTGPDSFYADLKWNLTIPVVKKVKFFTEFTIGNILNHRIPVSTSGWPSGFYRQQDTTVRSGVPANRDRTYTISPNATYYGIFGMPVSYGYGRSYSFDCGIRF